MTTFRALGVALIVVSSGPAEAWSQAFQTPPRETFDRLDANGDGVIEKGEVPEKALSAFERLLKLGDSDKDGKMQGNEFRDLVVLMRAGTPAAPGNNLGMFAVDPMGRFKALDKNGDGKVSRDEFTGRPAMFDRVDANGDGYLEAAEIKALVASAPKQAAAAVTGRPGSRIMAMDKDGDGRVSRGEYAGAPAVFDRLDSNGDGFLGKEEADDGPRVMLEQLRGMDANGDSKLSRDEFRGPAQRFERLDADKDGFVTFDEIRATLVAKPPASAAAKKSVSANKN
jgi:Ca2+-binding EF-hand superfamily protein